MQKDEVKIGESYMAKVTDKVVPVRIDSEKVERGRFELVEKAVRHG